MAGSCYSITEKGYMDTATFYSWLDKHFIPHLPPGRPVVLLVDSVGVHIDLDTFELATKNGVYIYKLLKKCYSPRLAGGCWFAWRHETIMVQKRKEVLSAKPKYRHHEEKLFLYFLGRGDASVNSGRRF